MNKNETIVSQGYKVNQIRISKNYGKMLATQKLKFTCPNDNKLYFIHKIDDLDCNFEFKYVTVMRLLKKAFGKIVFDMESSEGRNLNRILSYWRRHAKIHLQNGGKFSDIIHLPSNYYVSVAKSHETLAASR